MIMSLSFEREQSYRYLVGSPDRPVEVSYAIGRAIRDAGILRPNVGVDYSSIRVTEESGDIVLRWRIRYFDSIQYDSVSQRIDTVELLIHRSGITHGLLGIIPETIKFTEED